MDNGSDNWRNNVEAWKQQFSLTDCSFDTECIVNKGDLSDILHHILQELLPGETFEITEERDDEDRFKADVYYKNELLITLWADTDSDYLPEEFFEDLEEIPVLMKSGKRFYAISSEYLGQDAWYFCGTKTNLDAAVAAGLPLVMQE